LFSLDCWVMLYSTHTVGVLRYVLWSIFWNIPIINTSYWLHQQSSFKKIGLSKISFWFRKGHPCVLSKLLGGALYIMFENHVRSWPLPKIPLYTRGYMSRYLCILVNVFRFKYMFNVSIREYFSVLDVFIVCIRNMAMFK
jgi:hypothetical protein